MRPHDDHGSDLGEMDARVRALETLLVAKGLVDPQTLDGIVEYYETEVGPHLGAKVVAKAWVDEAYRAWLLEDATAAVAALGLAGRQGEHLVALASSPDVHLSLIHI